MNLDEQELKKLAFDLNHQKNDVLSQVERLLKNSEIMYDLSKKINDPSLTITSLKNLRTLKASLLALKRLEQVNFEVVKKKIKEERKLGLSFFDQDEDFE